MCDKNIKAIPSADSLHKSWKSSNMLGRALSTSCSFQIIEFLLGLGHDVSFIDPQTGRNIFHEAALGNHDSFVLQKLFSMLPDKNSDFLAMADLNSCTALDYAMEHFENTKCFSTLVSLGASMCSDLIAIKFYKTHIASPGSSNEQKRAFTRLMQVNAAVEWQVSLEEILPPQNV